MHIPGLGPPVQNAIVTQFDVPHRGICLEGLRKSLAGATHKRSKEIKAHIYEQPEAQPTLSLLETSMEIERCHPPKALLQNSKGKHHGQKQNEEIKPILRIGPRHIKLRGQA